MMQVIWSYEDGKSTLKQNEKEFTNSRLYQHLDKDLTDSAESIFRILSGILNADRFSILFQGADEHYSQLLRILNESPYKEKISLNREFEEETNYNQAIQKLTDFMQKTEVETWREEAALQQLESLQNLTASLYVVATMSAGKSTVLNAMLGDDLLPADHLASTSKLMKVVQNDRENYSAKAYDSERDVLHVAEFATKEALESWNKDESVDEIIIEGPLLKGQSQMNIELVDTPGPNNFQDRRHKDKIQQFIQTEERPVLLYIMDATKIGTEDDAEYIEMLNEWFQASDLKLEERTYFILNKIDILKSEQEVKRTMQSAQQFLSNFGVRNPKIIPVSAQFALLYRQKQKGKELERRDEGMLMFIGEELEALNVIQQSTLSSSLKQQLYMLQESQSVEERQILNTGVSVIEFALEQFIREEAFVQQAEDLVRDLNALAQQQLVSVQQETEAELLNLEAKREEVKTEEFNYQQTITERAKKLEVLVENKMKLIDKEFNDYPTAKQLIKRNEEELDWLDHLYLTNSSLDKSFYSKQQYQLIKNEAMQLLANVEKQLKILVELELPMNSKVQQQLDLVTQLLLDIRLDHVVGEKVVSRSGSDYLVKHVLYSKELVDFYFYEMVQGVWKQVKYFHEHEVMPVTLIDYVEHLRDRDQESLFENKKQVIQMKVDVVEEKEKKTSEDIQHGLKYLEEWVQVEVKGVL